MLKYKLTEFNVCILFADSLYTVSQQVDHPTDGAKFCLNQTDFENGERILKIGWVLTKLTYRHQFVERVFGTQCVYTVNRKGH